MDSFDLFTEFGLSSTPKAENGEKTAENSVSTAIISKEFSLSTSSSIQTVDEIQGTPEDLANSVIDSAAAGAISAKFLQFLEKLGFKDSASKNLDEKLDFVMKTYDDLQKENEKLKLLLATTDSTLSISKLDSDANDLFVVDTKFDPSNLNCQSESTFGGEISQNGIGYCTDESPSTKPKLECFNCGGGHVVSDCTEVLDRRKIQARRRLAAQQKISTNKEKDGGKKRYAAEQAKFRPGHVSQDLRRALGLRSRDVPPWIYQMRVLGYPPGHLKEAYHAPSSIVMFDDNGCPTKHKNGKKPRGFYDPEKLIDYPGFNCPLPSDVKDKCMDLGMPPMLPYQQKVAFVKYLNEEKDDVICLTDTCVVPQQQPTPQQQKEEVIIEDMEIAEIEEDPKNLPDTPESPTTQELKEERKRILALLQANDQSGRATTANSRAIGRVAEKGGGATNECDESDESVCIMEDEIVDEEEEDEKGEGKSRDIASPDAAAGSRSRDCETKSSSRDRGDQSRRRNAQRIESRRDGQRIESRDGQRIESRDGQRIESRDSLEPPTKRSRLTTTSRDPAGHTFETESPGLVAGGGGRRTPVIPIDPVTAVDGANTAANSDTAASLTPVTSSDRDEGSSSMTSSLMTSSMRHSHSAKSLSMELGTPVSMTPVSSRESPYYDGPRYTKKPTIEAFGLNIVKFEVQEQSIPCRGGGMQRLREILRKNSQKKK